MSPFRQVMLGILTAGFSAVIIFGSMLLTLSEGGRFLALALTPSVTATNPPPVDTPKPGEPTFTPSPTLPPSPTPTAPADCPAPAGWQAIDILPGDTLEGIATFYGASLDDLRQANCLTTDTLLPGNYLYVPGPTATPTLTEQPPSATPAPRKPSATPRPTQVCSGPPSGWVIYVVRRGDTLFAIGQAHGVSVQALVNANCLTSTVIRTGQRLYVPYVPTRTPLPSATPRPTNTSVPPTDVPPTDIPPTDVPPTDVPPTDVPPTDVPPTDVPPTVAPTEAPTPIIEP